MKSRKNFFISLIAILSSLTFPFSLYSCADDSGSNNSGGTTGGQSSSQSGSQSGGSSGSQSGGHVHNWVVTVTNPTCMEQGYTSYTCSCGESVKSDYVSSLGHDFSASGCSRCSATYSQGLSYKLSGDQTYYILSDEGTCTDENIIIPSSYDDLPVKEIASAAFSVNKNLKSVYIGDNVKKIDSYAFSNCSNLTSVEMSNSVTTIMSYAFQNCTKLKNIKFSTSLKEIESYAFYGCINLTSVKIPNGVTSIGSYAFSGCTNLSNIEIPDSVISIGMSLCLSTKYYNNQNNWQNDVLYIGKHLIEAKTSLPRSCEIRKDTICIADRAFDSCKNLLSIEIPDSVVSIGYGAFEDCINLNSVVIGSSVRYIGYNLFYSFASFMKVSSITFKNTNGWVVKYVGNSNSTPISILSSDLADTEKAAEYLKSNYESYTWTRES